MPKKGPETLERYSVKTQLGEIYSSHTCEPIYAGKFETLQEFSVVLNAVRQAEQIASKATKDQIGQQIQDLLYP